MQSSNSNNLKYYVLGINCQRPSPQGFQSFPAQPPQTLPASAPAQPQSQPVVERDNVRSVSSARAAEVASANRVAAAGGNSFQCPDSFGFFSHHKSCDKYWACENGTATLKLCGNGLVFDESDPRRENCAYPFSADCGSRTDLGESPKPA